MIINPKIFRNNKAARKDAADYLKELSNLQKRLDIKFNYDDDLIRILVSHNGKVKAYRPYDFDKLKEWIEQKKNQSTLDGW